MLDSCDGCSAMLLCKYYKRHVDMGFLREIEVHTDIYNILSLGQEAGRTSLCHTGTSCHQIYKFVFSKIFVCIKCLPSQQMF